MALVMVIDDSRLVGMVIQRMLSEHDIECVLARSASEVFGFRGATPLLREHKPDIILLDIMMPDMDGLDILRKLKSMKNEQHIPVLMISASASESNVLEAVNRGAEGFISKPIDADKLMKELATIAGTHQIDGLLKKLGHVLDPSRRTEKEYDALILGPANLNYMLEILDGDMDMLYELIAVFVEDAPGQLDDIENALTKSNAQDLRRAAHTFKGSVSNMGAPLLTDKALALEKMGLENRIDDGPAAYRELRGDADNLLAALKQWLKQ